MMINQLMHYVYFPLQSVQIVNLSHFQEKQWYRFDFLSSVLPKTIIYAYIFFDLHVNIVICESNSMNKFYDGVYENIMLSLVKTCYSST